MINRSPKMKLPTVTVYIKENKDTQLLGYALKIIMSSQLQNMTKNYPTLHFYSYKYFI